MTESTRRIVRVPSDDLDPPELLTVSEAAARAHTTTQTIRDWIEKGLPCVKARRRPGASGRIDVTYIDAEDLLPYSSRYQ